MKTPPYTCPRYDNACPSMASCTLHGCKRCRGQEPKHPDAAEVAPTLGEHLEVFADAVTTPSDYPS